MKRHLSITLSVLALGLALCSSAQAAVSFGFTEAKHQETTIYRGDGLVTYAVKVKNTGADPTAGATNVAVALPAGVKFAAGMGAGWSCQVSAQSCFFTNSVVAGAEFPKLEIQAWIYPEAAPETILTTFTAYGGGAGTAALATDSVTMAPEKPFELINFAAAACSGPPATPSAGLCFSGLGGADYTQAGGHPFAATSTFSFPTRVTAQKGQAELAPVQNLRDLYFDLPAGFVGNPEAASPACTVTQVQAYACPESAAIGGISVDIGDFVNSERPIFKLIPEEGYPAAFAFQPVGLSPITVVLRVKLRSNGDYGVTAVSPLPPQVPEIDRVNYATICGFGAKTEDQPQNGVVFKGCKASTPSTVPFLTNPTRCAGAAPETDVQIDSFQHPGLQTDEGFPDLADSNWKIASAVSPSGTGCEALTQAWVGVGKPTLAFQPDNSNAATPAAYSANLHIPQGGLKEVGGLGSAHLKDTTVVLPTGIALNPGAADGLGACTSAQAGLVGTGFPSPNPIHFRTTSVGCPLNSKIGTAQVSTPILADPLDGAVYLAAQEDNPFGSKFAIYLVIDDSKTGIKATLAGRVSPDKQTGQITTVFQNNPQAPVEDIELDFFGGSRSSLANPDVCGTHTTRTELTPWSAVDPDHPTAAEIAVSEDPVTIDAPPAGQSTCATSKAARPFNLGFSARSTNPTAGATTPFVLRLTRPDGSQELDEVSVTTPPGFSAILKGVGICSEAALAAAGAPGRTGAAEFANPSCPASSQVGTTTIGAGVGPTPVYVKTGRIYLSGPYKGAPLSFAFVVPALAGPFDLGVQIVRTALYVNPKTAQVNAKSDPIPQLLEGVPLQIRDVRVNLDRPSFSLNPTSCEPLSFAGRITGSNGAVANLGSRFQVGGCEKLRFKPGLKLQLHGGTKRSDYQRLEATVTYPKGGGYANIARTAVTLPHSAFLAQEHIRTVCTRVQFAADQCPKGSIYGRAEATTPLLDGKLTGPVYLRSSDNPLPDLVIALRGPDAQPIEVELSGRTDSKDGGIRNTFDLVPDAPVSTFNLELFGGQKSLIVNSRDLCKSKQRATVRMTAHNGMTSNFRSVVRNDCGKGRKGGRKGSSGKKGKPRLVAVAASLDRLWKAF
jgi:hypothetical protein